MKLERNSLVKRLISGDLEGFDSKCGNCGLVFDRPIKRRERPSLGALGGFPAQRDGPAHD